MSATDSGVFAARTSMRLRFDARIEKLEKKLQQKNKVLDEFMEELVKLRGSMGSSEKTLGSP